MTGKLLMLVVLFALLNSVSAQVMITNCTELQNMNLDLAGNYALANDIDCSGTASWNGGTGFEPVGNSSLSFAGNFDGKGHTVHHLSVHLPGTNDIGLFGTTNATAVIQSVALLNYVIEGKTNVGGLVGLNRGVVRQCSASGNATGSTSFAGGLLGRNEGLLSNSHSSGNVTGSTDSGGLVGYNFRGDITSCYATSIVTGSAGIGGLVGYNPSQSSISNSYATGTVVGANNFIGGLAGRNDGILTNCYTTSSVTGSTDVGGLVGFNAGGSSSNSYWDTQTSGQASSDGGTGKTTVEMYQEATFVGWDFTDTWWIDEGTDYPLLRWFLPPTVQNPLSDKVIPVNELFTLSAAAVFEDLSNTGLNYTAVLSPDNVLPAWLTFTPQDQNFSGTPQSGDAGNYVLIITACSTNLLCVTDQFILYVRIPVGISNCTELQAMKDDLYGIYYLTNDIDCSDTVNWNGGEGFEPVGDFGIAWFFGIFEGNDYIISDLTINRPTKNGVGLFGSTWITSTIEKVGLTQVNITGQQWVGSLAGLTHGAIHDSYSTGFISGTFEVGGLVGVNSGTFATLTSSHTSAEVIGDERVGGLVGQNILGSSIFASHASGTVTLTTNIGGGLVGSNIASSAIRNCYATTNIIGPGDRAGGLVGLNQALVENSASFGDITNCVHYVGGLVGVNDEGTVTNSYAQTTISASGNNAGGLVGWNDYIISNSYSTGLTTGNINVGGLVGNNRPTGTITKSYSENTVSAPGSTGGGFVGINLGTVQECYSKGVASANLVLGGFIADNSGAVTQSYWDTQTSGLATSDGGTGRTTAQMYQQATFSGWNFAGTWWIDEDNDYPKLQALTAPLVQNPIQDQNTFSDVLFLFTVPSNTFFDFTSPTLTFDAKQPSDTTLPVWLTFFPNNQTFSGWPMPADRGQYTIEVTACDDLNQCTTDSFTLSVNNHAPTLAQPIADQRFTAEVLFDWQVPINTFSDTEDDIFVYTAELMGGDPLPVWLSFNGTTGTFSGVIPSSQTASLQIDITVFDGYGGQASDSFELQVNFAPVVNGIINSQTASVGNPFLYTFPASLFNEPDGEAVTYSSTQTNGDPLPAWLTLDTGILSFLGTPGAGDTGFLFVFLIASDPHNASASISFGIAVSSIGSGNNPPVLTVAIPAQSGNLEELWTFVVPSTTFEDPESDTLTYSATLEGGLPLPLWLTFDPLTQTFSGATTAPGAWRVTVRVEDGNGGFALSTFTLTIEDTRNRLPVLLNPLPNQEVKVDTNFGYTIPDNTFSDPNDDTLLYTAVQSGNRSLPGWLTFDEASRAFSGKPSNTDTDTFADRKHTIQVCAHDEEASACSDFLLTVSGASATQEALTGLIIVGSIVSGLIGAWQYRGPLWNFFMQKKYMKPKQTITLGTEFNQQIDHASNSVSELQIYHNGKLFKRGLPWLTYEFDDKHHLIGTPTKETHAGNYLFSLIGHHNQIVVAYPLRVKKTDAADDDDAEQGWWATLTGLCSTRKKKGDLEMDTF